MDIRMRISNVSGYFRMFNISDGVAYIMAAFPDEKWTVPSELFGKVKVKKHEGTSYYFFTDMENGTDVLFDALEEVIKDNMILLEKVSLLKKYVEELKTMVYERSIEDVRNIRIVVNDDRECADGISDCQPKPNVKNKSHKKACTESDRTDKAEKPDVKTENEASSEVSDAAIAMLNVEG